jgi:predicted ATPase
MKGNNLIFKVSNFGPVVSGKFQLKPLTIFIGPNNCGKTYCAELVYSLLRSLNDYSGRLAYSRAMPSYDFARQKIKVDQSIKREVKKWADNELSKGRSRSRIIQVSELPQHIRENLSNTFTKYCSKLSDDFENSLKNYFGCETLDELIRKGKDTKGKMSFSVNIEPINKKVISYSIQRKGKRSRCTIDLEEISKLKMRSINSNLLLDMSRDSNIRDIAPAILFHYLWNGYLEDNGFPTKGIYYLPAGRSGILQGWQVLAAVAVSIVRERWGYEPIEVPALTGVAGDFLQYLISTMGSRYPGSKKGSASVLKAIETLEKDLLKGETVIRESKRQRPILMYRTQKLELPLSRVSSMIAELASLDIWLKQFIDKDDLIIIDEPESHLHPEGQRIIARVITRLVNSGVNIFITTHSPTILHQFSNYLLSNNVEKENRSGLGITEADILKRKDLGVYVFELKEEGSYISEVMVDDEFGIPEDEFVRILDSLGDETVQLYSSKAA